MALTIEDAEKVWEEVINTSDVDDGPDLAFLFDKRIRPMNISAFGFKADDKTNKFVALSNQKESAMRSGQKEKYEKTMAAVLSDILGIDIQPEWVEFRSGQNIQLAR